MIKEPAWLVFIKPRALKIMDAVMDMMVMEMDIAVVMAIACMQMKGSLALLFLEAMERA